MNDRYEGKPFLRLLECYVLWSVDQLRPGQALATTRICELEDS